MIIILLICFLFVNISAIAIEPTMNMSKGMIIYYLNNNSKLINGAIDDAIPDPLDLSNSATHSENYTHCVLDITLPISKRKECICDSNAQTVYAQANGSR